MKTLKIIIFGIGMFVATSLQAQVSISLHLGTPPQWAPSGYSEARYYYLPDVEAYYDVDAQMFIYLSGGRWIHRASLPSRYRNYDLYGGYKVVMSDYRGNRPYDNYKEYRYKYAKGYRGQPQHSIGDRPNRDNSRNNMRSDNHSNYRMQQERGQVRERSNNQKMNKENNRGNNKSKKNK